MFMIICPKIIKIFRKFKRFSDNRIAVGLMVINQSAAAVLMLEVVTTHCLDRLFPTVIGRCCRIGSIRRWGIIRKWWDIALLPSLLVSISKLSLSKRNHQTTIGRY